MNQKCGFKEKWKGRHVRKTAIISLTMVMASAMLSACSGASPDKQEKQVLRIGMLYGSADNEAYMRQQYTETFEYTHPNVELEIVYAMDYNETAGLAGAGQTPDSYAKMKDFLTGSNPCDVIMVDYSQLARLNQDGLLQQLDPLIEKDKFDISDLVPSVVEGIKSASDNNNIYALAPTFNSMALFYNKAVFQKAGVAPPTDNMMWPQILDLAREVSGGQGADQVFGLQMNRWMAGMYDDVTSYVSQLQLKVTDDKAEKMLVDSGSAWTNAIKTIADLYKNKVSPSQEEFQKVSQAIAKKYENEKTLGYNPLQGDLFAAGNVAMTMADYSYINQLNGYKLSLAQLKGFKPVDWDVVTVPQFEEKPGISRGVSFNALFGINARAQNPDGAWEFIKFLNSKEWAKLKSRSTYEMSSREEYIKPIDGMDYNVKAFYTLKPIPPVTVDSDVLSRTKPNAQSAIYNIAQQLFQEAADGKKTAEEVVKEWAEQGNAALQKTESATQDSSGAYSGMIATPEGSGR